MTDRDIIVVYYDSTMSKQQLENFVNYMWLFNDEHTKIIILPKEHISKVTRL